MINKIPMTALRRPIFIEYFTNFILLNIANQYNEQDLYSK